MMMKSFFTSAAAVVMMVCLASSAVKAEGTEACLDACFTPHEIKHKCPPGFRPVVRQKNCYKCCRYY
ncbi:hypothetical protein [Absidia glauca]|uniref:Uncharacterized protein n=1 Tax=Absidia glauca TaxID=4829 RepID=A0A168LMH6_ABSGL|nr:hypothetical protein [Absidia glauca]